MANYNCNERNLIIISNLKIGETINTFEITTNHEKFIR
jgi:hypothetical protein